MQNKILLSRMYQSKGIVWISPFIYLISFLPSITAPTMAAKNNTADTSKGNKKSWNNT
jgi:hypothetical protein